MIKEKIKRPDVNRQNKTITIRLNDKERALFKRAAWKEGMIVSECYRMLIKNFIRKVLPEVTK